jgi:hypothetical protein
VSFAGSKEPAIVTAADLPYYRARGLAGTVSRNVGIDP